jgi:chromosome segregation ATPase
MEDNSTLSDKFNNLENNHDMLTKDLTNSNAQIKQLKQELALAKMQLKEFSDITHNRDEGSLHLEERIHKLQSELVKFQTLADDYKVTIKEFETLLAKQAIEINGLKLNEQQLRCNLELSEINLARKMEEIRMLTK